jgi:hypothetical protein
MICSACGENLIVPDDEPGDVVQCVGCGKRIRLHREADSITADTQESLGSGTPRKTKPPVRSSGGRSSKLMLTAGLTGAVTAAVLVVVALVVEKNLRSGNNSSAASTTLTAAAAPLVHWDQAHRPELLAMKKTADELAQAGDWQQSYDAYQQILTYVADHSITDPVAITIVESVRPGQDRAMSAIVANRLALSAPVAPPATVPPTAQTFAPAAQAAATTLPVVPSSQPAATALLNATTEPTTAPVATLDAVEIAADTAPPLPNAPSTIAPLHAYTLPDAVTDEQIGDAIDKGVKFLAGQFVNGEVRTGLGDASGPENHAENHPDRNRNRPSFAGPSNLDNPSDLGSLPPPGAQLPPPPSFVAPWESAFSTPGIDALCVYALLNGGRAMDVPGLAVNDPFTVQILDRLKQYNMQFTYHRSLRAAALAVFNRTEDNAAMEDDVRWLLAASVQGGYTYTLPTNGMDALMPDNSNSQYGLLGVWSGAQAGKAVAQQYWLDVERHWNNCAIGNGTWGYTVGSAASTTMTCAGVASLLVAREYIDTANMGNGMGGDSGDRPSQSPMLNAGLSWLDTGDNCLSNLAGDGMGGAGYGLYGLERVGLASGFKYFGKHDWYAELARQLVAQQHLDGSWGGSENRGKVQSQTLIDTAYALLFLARGRHPILFNKLRYDGDWNDRPHDAAHLARFAGSQLERPLNWQVVNLRRNWFDWMDCPVLYISGDRRLKLLPQDYQALREFAEGGGTIFTHADGGSGEFNRWVAELVRQIFPKYELTQVPRDHALYSTVYKIKNPPPLLAVSNGSRLMLIHSPTDLAGGWQLNWTDEKKQAFQMGTNLFVYAAGKGNLKNRLSSTYIPEDPDQPDSSRPIARLQYAGAWDPEPYAWARFSRYFQWETHQAIEPVVVAMTDLKPGQQPLAVLTGTVRHDFTDAEAAGVRAYVQGGGVLLIDACGGQADFIKSVETTLLPRAFAGAVIAPIAANHPLLIASRAGAEDLTHPLLRGYANENGGKQQPMEAMAVGKGWVIFSRLDLTTGLLGTESWGIRGYEPAYAMGVVKNAVLWGEARMGGGN